MTSQFVLAAVLKKKDYRVMIEGNMGPAPDSDQLCSAYIFNRMLSSKSTVRNLKGIGNEI